jgi:Na+-transporting methylmalonyl-CoA/oxaloacetate decarboxylase gamma subunit
MGMSAVVFSLLLLIFTMKILTWLFPVKKEAGEAVEKKKDRKKPEDILASSAPDEVLAVAAVEHHRRQMALGRRLGDYGKKTGD